MQRTEYLCLVLAAQVVINAVAVFVFSTVLIIGVRCIRLYLTLCVGAGSLAMYQPDSLRL